MNKKLISYFNSIMLLTDDEVEGILETMCVKQFKKGRNLLREGEISSEVYFVLGGCVRLYYLVDGEEETSNFFTEGQWVIALKNISEVIPSAHFLDCCTDSSLVVGNREKEEELYGRFPRFETVSRKIMEKTFVEQQEIMATYLIDTPEQRYLKLLKSRPELFQQIPQYQIASYIGIKPKSLNRIKKRILKL